MRGLSEDVLLSIASITCQDHEGRDKFGTQDPFPQRPVPRTRDPSLPPQSHWAIPMRHALLEILGSPEQNNDSVIGSRGHRQRKFATDAQDCEDSSAGSTPCVIYLCYTTNSFQDPIAA